MTIISSPGSTDRNTTNSYFRFECSRCLISCCFKSSIKTTRCTKIKPRFRAEFNAAVNNVTDESIQHGFIRAYSCDQFGDLDKRLIPDELKHVEDYELDDFEPNVDPGEEMIIVIE